MKFGKKTAFAALVAASALVMAGCAGSGDVIEEGGGTDTGSGDGEMYIALVSKGFQHQFWQAVKAGAAVKLGCDHRHYPAHLQIAPETLASLAGDLA